MFSRPGLFHWQLLYDCYTWPRYSTVQVIWLPKNKNQINAWNIGHKNNNYLKKGDLILPDKLDGITAEIPPSKFKSDISTNVAMVLSKVNKKSCMPRYYSGTNKVSATARQDGFYYGDTPI